MAVKKIVIDKANRLYRLPPTLMSSLEKGDRRRLGRKLDTLDLATFRWPVTAESDLEITEQGLQEASSEQIEKLKEELAAWFQNHHRVRLNAAKEIFVTSGISNAILSLGLAFIDSGDLAFVPELGLPHFRRVVAACGGHSIEYCISERNDWSPDFDRLNAPAGRVAKLLFLNTPHNPTGATLGPRELAGLIEKAGRENILIVNDAAYQSMSDRKPYSLLAAEGGKRIGVELYSFSYAFGLPRQQFGFVAGNREIISGLAQASKLSPSRPRAYQVDQALSSISNFPSQDLKNVRKRLEASAAAALNLIDMLQLEKTGLDSVPYIWAKISRRRSAVSLANLLYRRARILTAPGADFGDTGEGFLRFSLTAPAETYKAACERVRKKHKLLAKSTGEA
jgi:aspartate/methionine/tyrosine aminotransferase